MWFQSFGPQCIIQCFMHQKSHIHALKIVLPTVSLHCLAYVYVFFQKSMWSLEEPDHKYWLLPIYFSQMWVFRITAAVCLFKLKDCTDLVPSNSRALCVCVCVCVCGVCCVLCVEGSARREVSVVGSVRSSRMKLLLFILDVRQALKSQNKTSECAHSHMHTCILKLSCFVPHCSLCYCHRDDRRRQTDGQLVSKVTGRLHYRGNIRRRHSILVREHQQINGSHTGE